MAAMMLLMWKRQPMRFTSGSQVRVPAKRERVSPSTESRRASAAYPASVALKKTAQPPSPEVMFLMPSKLKQTTSPKLPILRP